MSGNDDAPVESPFHNVPPPLPRRRNLEPRELACHTELARATALEDESGIQPATQEYPETPSLEDENGIQTVTQEDPETSPLEDENGVLPPATQNTEPPSSLENDNVIPSAAQNENKADGGNAVSIDERATQNTQPPSSLEDDNITPSAAQNKNNDGNAVSIDQRSTSMGASARAARFVARLRTRIRHGHQLLARRLGIGFMLCSVIHTMTLTVVLLAAGEGVLCAEMTLALSVSAFVLHCALALADDALRLRSAVHFALIVLDAFVKGAVAAVQGELGSAAFYLGFWCLCLYPLCAAGLWRVLCAAQNFEQSTRELILHSTIAGFAGSGTPMLYFFFNGLLCIAFESDAYCAARIRVNFVAILALVANSMLLVLLSVRPVSLRQMTHLDIPTSQQVAFLFYAVLLFLAITLHSQNENFGPVTVAVDVMSRAGSPCFLLFLIAVAFILIQSQNREATVAAENEVEDTAGSATTQFGPMIPHRITMACFTALYLLTELCEFGDMIRVPFAPLSAASAVFHVWVTMEQSSVSWGVVLHFLAHSSSALIRGVRCLCNGETLHAMVMLGYIIVGYPGLYKILTQFRSSVRSHGKDSAAECAAVAFVAFWGGALFKSRPPNLVSSCRHNATNALICFCFSQALSQPCFILEQILSVRPPVLSPCYAGFISCFALIRVLASLCCRAWRTTEELYQPRQRKLCASHLVSRVNVNARVVLFDEFGISLFADWRLACHFL